MKFKLLPLLLSLLLWSFVSLGQSDPCWECGKIKLALFDFDVQVPKPSDPNAVTAWKKLFLPAGHANTQLSDALSAGECFDAFNAFDYEQHSPDPDHVNLPTERAPSYANYLVTGTVTGSGDDYTVHMKVVGADNRKVAVSSSASFKLSDPDGPRDAAIKAVAQLSPLAEKIMAFEKAEREANTDIALQSMIIGESNVVEIKITPAKTTLSQGEEIEVEIEMVDCDGYKLKNRKVKFTTGTVSGLPYPISGTTCGTVIPAEVTTDEQGKAKVKYRAGSSPCSGKIVAYWGFTNPSGSQGMLYGEVPINVVNTDTWYVDVLYQFKFESNTNKTSTAAEYTKKEKGSTKQQIEYRAQFLYRPKEPMTHDINISSLAEPEEGQVLDFYEEGKYVSMGNSYMNTTYTDGTVLTDRAMHLFKGAPTPTERSAINFSYGSSGKTFSLDLKLLVDQWAKRAGFFGNSNTTSTEVQSVAQGLLLDGIWGKIDILPPTGKSNFTVYRGTYLDETTRNEPGFSSSAIEDIRVYVTSPTIINGILDDGGTTDNGLQLEQNFPNPFSAFTVIPYTLPARAHVSLKIVDLTGREVKSLVNEVKPAGNYTLSIDGNSLKPGVYLYVLQVGRQVITKKLVHL